MPREPGPLAVGLILDAHWQGEEARVMASTTTPTYTPPTWSLHGSAQIRRAWETLDALYRRDPWDARLQGARAAAEWSMGMSAVSPVTNDRKTPDQVTCRWESHRASMRELGIGAPPIAGQSADDARRYARGASAWLFWWTGLEGLPAWLLRIEPRDAAAS